MPPWPKVQSCGVRCCACRTPLGQRAEGPSGKHHRAQATPQCGGNILWRRLKPLFSGNRGRSLFDFLELRLEPALEQPIEAVEIEVNHRGDIERKELRQHQAA